VNEYLYEAHGETGANAIIGDIDRRYVFFFFFFIFLQGSGRRSMSSQEYLLCLFFPDYDAFLMGVTLRNGQVTTQKRL
jgi:hypothetical protein